MPGGEYKATVTFPWTGYAPATRKFDIRSYRAPRIKTQLEFLRKAYGPGDKVTAVMSAKRAEGGIPNGAKVSAIARVDGAVAWRGDTKIDATGNCSVQFELPKKIKAGVGSLTLVIRDGGVVETASKTLPILLQLIPITFCPEGGDLVAGLECGLYFEATTPWGEPADVAGEILDSGGSQVADFRSTHEGRGRVSFTPAAGRQYFAHVTEPAGITQLVELPQVALDGVSLRADKPCYEAGDALGFHVAASSEGKYKLVLAQRENEIVSQELELKGGVSQAVSLKPETCVDGVLRATLFDTDGKPLAERLVFRRAQNGLQIKISASPENAVPGDKVELTVHTTTSKGEPVSAVVGLTVTDDAVLQMIEKRKQAPRLPAMVLLEDEVDHLEDAHVYLADDARAPQAIDLLLGTQGWRRFAYLQPDEFLKKYGDKGKRAVAFRAEPLPRTKGKLARGAALGGGGRAGEPVPNAAPKPDVADKANAEQPKKAQLAKPAAEEVKAKKAFRRDEKKEADFARRPAMRRLITVREYAHKLRDGRKPGAREDFSETLYWNAGVKTNERGEAKVSFYLSDSVTSFRVMADGFTDKGALGQADAMITSRQPFYLEPKLPLEVTAGDTVMLPVSLVNSTAGNLKVVLKAEAGEGISLPADFAGKLELKSDGRGRLLLPVQVGRANGKVTLSLDGQAGAFGDRVTREIAVRPTGFPISYSAGGMLDKPQAITVNIPEDVHVSTITTSAKVYPTPAANLMEAVKALLREPGG
jgi:hypothetical protein